MGANLDMWMPALKEVLEVVNHELAQGGAVGMTMAQASCSSPPQMRLANTCLVVLHCVRERLICCEEGASSIRCLMMIVQSESPHFLAEFKQCASHRRE